MQLIDACRSQPLDGLGFAMADEHGLWAAIGDEASEFGHVTGNAGVDDDVAHVGVARQQLKPARQRLDGVADGIQLFEQADDKTPGGNVQVDHQAVSAKRPSRRHVVPGVEQDTNARVNLENRRVLFVAEDYEMAPIGEASRRI